MLKTTILILSIITLFSCNDDKQKNSTEQTAEVVGVWERSDVTDMQQYKIFFNEENTGYITEYIQNPDSTAISSLNEFVWNPTDKTLTVEYTAENDESFQYSINTEGQLLIPNLTDLHFNKVE